MYRAVWSSLPLLLGACGSGASAPALQGQPAERVALQERAELSASDASSGDCFGASVAGVGDADGDGYPDVLVGAPYHRDEVLDGSGAAYLYLGSSTGLDTTSEVQLSPPTGAEAFGYHVDGAGDVNGDGLADLIVGGFSTYGQGKAWVYHGSSTGVDFSSETELQASDGSSGAAYGSTVAGAGDVDGDGYDDVLVGAGWQGSTYAGAAYLVHGSASGVDASDEEVLGSSTAESYAYFGNAVSGAGDVNGDGYADVVIGAYGSNTAMLDDVGAAYVFEGSATGVDLDSEIALLASDGTAYDYFGISVAGVGDVDGDGHDDVLVGVRDDADGGYEAGSAYLYLGSTDGVDASTELKITPSDTSAGDLFGWFVSGAGDLDGDGYADLMVGASGDSDVRPNAGAVYAYLGSSSGLDLSSELQVHADDAVPNDGFGYDVDSAGDVDGDGAPELVASAPFDDDAGRDAGSIYVFGCATWYRDRDGDGYGDATDSLVSCEEPSGYATELDCDDTDAAIHPGAAEIPADGIDQDCDGGELCWGDLDEDGFVGDQASVVSEDLDCDDPGEVGSAGGGDCEDADPAVNPGAEELPGDERDQDCDGAELCLADADGDGYSAISTTVVSGDLDCRDPGEALAADPGGDCDDHVASVHPGAIEVPADGVDQDCDGLETCYEDADQDGYGSGQELLSEDPDCHDPGELDAGAPLDDCDDADPEVHPMAADECGDGVDSDCDGVGGPDSDEDGDGWTWTQEQHAGTSDCNVDTDGDGVWDPEDDHPTGGCQGCASGAAGPAPLGLLALLPLLGLRRRRVRT